MLAMFYSTWDDSKAAANGPVGQVLAGPLFLKVKTKFHFTKANNKQKYWGDFWACCLAQLVIL